MSVGGPDGGRGGEPASAALRSVGGELAEANGSKGFYEAEEKYRRTALGGKRRNWTVGDGTDGRKRWCWNRLAVLTRWRRGKGKRQ